MPPPLSRRSAALREHVRARARNLPGVYRFLGPRGEPLYVGKSVRVRARILSYFRAEPGEKGAELVRGATTIDWDYVATEFEALLTEFRLIRELRPRFNVRHRRDRRFAWVKLTRGPAPRLQATRSPTPDGHAYFGPFPAPRALPKALHRLARLQGLRDCAAATPIRFSDQLDLLSGATAPLCPRAELGSCLGPCAALCSEGEYGERVRRTIDFLNGRTDDPLHRLSGMIRRAAAQREYEVAGKLRDSEERLRAVRDEIVAFRDFLEGLNFVYRIPVEEARIRCYLIRGGRVRLTFDEPSPGDSDVGELATRIRNLLEAPEPPAAALESKELEELFLTARWFRDRPNERLHTVAPEEYIRNRLATRLAAQPVQADTAGSGDGLQREPTRRRPHPTTR